MMRPFGSPPIRLIPRAVRATVGLPLVFNSSEGRVAGYSLNVSESGILGSFQDVLEVWLSGQLTICVPEHPIYVETRIVRVEGKEAAMSFLKLSELDRTRLRRHVEAAATAEDVAAALAAPVGPSAVPDVPDPTSGE
ncbi:PilZ domain-containing protein [Bryocella elongata]|nr:PilZ domain-containing protein [Bryocella elongata]